MDFVETKFFSKNHVLDFNLKNENMSKNCPRKRKKNAKMNSRTQKYFTLKNVWKMMIMKIEEKIMKIQNGSIK